MPDSNNPNVATDTPNYGITPWTSWGVRDWQTWFGSLVSAYGIEVAKQKWLSAWHDQGFFDFNESWAKYDSEFMQWAKDNGLYVDTWLLPTVINDVKQIVSTSSNILKYAIPALLIMGILVAGSIVVREGKKVKLT